MATFKQVLLKGGKRHAIINLDAVQYLKESENAEYTNVHFAEGQTIAVDGGALRLV